MLVKQGGGPDIKNNGNIGGEKKIQIFLKLNL